MTCLRMAVDRHHFKAIRTNGHFPKLYFVRIKAQRKDGIGAHRKVRCTMAKQRCASLQDVRDSVRIIKEPLGSNRSSDRGSNRRGARPANQSGLLGFLRSSVALFPSINCIVAIRRSIFIFSRMAACNSWSKGSTSAAEVSEICLHSSFIRSSRRREGTDSKMPFPSQIGLSSEFCTSAS